MERHAAVSLTAARRIESGDLAEDALRCSLRNLPLIAIQRIRPSQDGNGNPDADRSATRTEKCTCATGYGLASLDRGLDLLVADWVSAVSQRRQNYSRQERMMFWTVNAKLGMSTNAVQKSDHIRFAVMQADLLGDRNSIRPVTTIADKMPRLALRIGRAQIAAVMTGSVVIGLKVDQPRTTDHASRFMRHGFARCGLCWLLRRLKTSTRRLARNCFHYLIEIREVISLDRLTGKKFPSTVGHRVKIVILYGAILIPLQDAAFREFKIIQQSEQVVVAQSATNALAPQFLAVCDIQRNESVIGDVGDDQSTARLEDPAYLLKNTSFVRGQIHNAIRNNDIDRTVLHGKLFQEGLLECDIPIAKRFRHVFLCSLGNIKHRVSHINTDRPAILAHKFRRDEALNSRAAAKIEHDFTRPDLRL